MRNLTFFGKLYLALSLFLVGGSIYLWLTGTELGTEEREKAEQTSPDHTAGGTHHHRYGFGLYGYHGGK